MKCPACGSEQADDAVVCGSCDHIIDPTFFSAEPPADDDDVEPPGAVPPRRTSQPRPRSSRAEAASGAPRRRSSGARPSAPRRAPAADDTPVPKRMAMPEAPARRIRTPPEQKVPVEDWHSAPAPLRPAPAPVGSHDTLDPEEWLTNMRHFLSGLSFAEKLSFWGSVAAMVACAFPWRETAAEGPVLGFFSMGVMTFGTGLLSTVAVATRARRAMPKLNPLVLWLVQLGSLGVAIVWCLVLMIAWWDSTLVSAPVGNYEMYASKPSLGLYAGLLSAVVALAGTALALKEKA